MILHRTALVLAALALAGCARFAAASEQVGPPLPEGGVAEAGVGEGGTDGAADAGTRLAFVSPGTYVGSLGAPPTWDARCQTLAEAAQKAGTFVAWVSTRESLAIDRLGRDQRRWIDVKGNVVAAGIEALTSGVVRLDLDLAGSQVRDANAWTGTLADGGPAADNCDRWTSSSKDVVGLYGESNVDGGGWTARNTEECGQDNRIYCFER